MKLFRGDAVTHPRLGRGVVRIVDQARGIAFVAFKGRAPSWDQELWVPLVELTCVTGRDSDLFTAHPDLIELEDFTSEMYPMEER